MAALPPAGDPDTVVQDDLALARAWLRLAQGDARGAADTALELDRADSWGCSSPTLLPWRSVASVKETTAPWTSSPTMMGAAE